MTSAPSAAGNGCVYITTDTPEIDATTAYPPFVNQVTVTYNAANGTLTDDGVADLFSSTRPTDASEVGGVGDSAYSTGTNVTALNGGVMAIVNIGATMRPESEADVQAMASTIAVALFDVFPD